MSDKLLRKELIKLAHSNPSMRPYLIPILKSAAEEEVEEEVDEKEAKKATLRRRASERLIAKMLGQLWTTADGSLSLKLAMRSGTGTAYFKKFLMAYNTRKLNISFDDTTMTMTIQKGPPEDLMAEV